MIRPHPLVILIACNKRVFCVFTDTLWNAGKLLSQSVVVSSKTIRHIFLINLKICLYSYSCHGSYANPRPRLEFA